MRSYRLFRVFGISVEVHSTFLLLLALLVFSPDFLFFFLTAFFFVFLHELSHSLVAKSASIPVERITLTPIGGIATVEIPEKPWLELGMSVAGPLFNFVVVGACLVLINGMGLDFMGYMNLLQSGELDFGLPYLLFTVLYINLVLGLFNILPGFPMDGGRILRSLLALFMDYGRATHVAVSVGRYLVFPLMFVAGVLFGNIFLVFISIVLYLAGGHELRFTRMRGVFSGVRVFDVMAPKPHSIEENTMLLSFLNESENMGQMFHVVHAKDGRVLGILDLSSLSEVSAQSAAQTTVGSIASRDYAVVSAESEVNSELKTLLSKSFVLVVSEKKVVGCLTPEILHSRMPLLALKKTFV